MNGLSSAQSAGFLNKNSTGFLPCEARPTQLACVGHGRQKPVSLTMSLSLRGSVPSGKRCLRPDICTHTRAPFADGLGQFRERLQLRRQWRHLNQMVKLRTENKATEKSLNLFDGTGSRRTGTGTAAAASCTSLALWRPWRTAPICQLRHCRHPVGFLLSLLPTTASSFRGPEPPPRTVFPLFDSKCFAFFHFHSLSIFSIGNTQHRQKRIP